MWNVECDRTMGNANELAYFYNFGTFRKNAADGLTKISLATVNLGTFRIDQGDIEFASTYVSQPSASLALAIRFENGQAIPSRVIFDLPLVATGGIGLLVDPAIRANPGEAFNVMTFPSLRGSWERVNGLVVGSAWRLEPLISPTTFSISVKSTSGDALAEIFTTRLSTNVLLSWSNATGDWKLYSSPSITDAKWTPVDVTGTNSTVLHLDQPQEFYRLVRD